MPAPTPIRKPGETDPDYRCDGTGHYLLAIDHKLAGLTGRQLDEAWRYAQTPLGGYRPVPSARKFHRSAKRFRFALGGNRSSKSHSLAVDAMWRATGLDPFRTAKTPSIGWYATTTWDKVGDTIWPKLDPSAGGMLKGLPYPFTVVWHNKQRNIPLELRIRLPHGTSRIIFKAFEQGRESFQAVDLDWANFDEQFDESIFTETLSRIGPGRRVDFTAGFTPLIPQEWLERRTTIEQRASDDVWYFPLDDNRLSCGGFIDDALIDGTIENWAPEVRETRRNGRWGAYQGVIFQTFRRSVHVVDVAKERRLFLKGDRVPYAVHAIGSIDWGGNNPFAFLWLVRLPHLDDDWYVLDELYWDFAERGPRRLEDQANEIKERTKRWGTMLARCYADHDPTDAHEFMCYGVPSIPADKKNKLAGIEALQALLHPRKHLSNPDFPEGRPRLHVAERCANLVREMAGYRWRPASGNEQAADAPREPLKKDDHAVDCLRYAVESEKAYEAMPLQRPTLGPQFRRAF